MTMPFDQFHEQILSRYALSDPVISFGSESVTMERLRLQVERYSSQLEGHGVAPGSIVAVEAGAGWKWVAGMLAAMKAGGVYMPWGGRAGARAELAPEPSFLLDPDADGFKPLDSHPRADGPPLPSPAYLIPTSGSTGERKWIVGNVEGLIDFIAWEREALGVTKSDKVSLLTRPTFDPVFRDVFLPLSAGAQLAIPDSPDIVIYPELCLDWLRRERVTITHVIPTLIRLWNRAPPGAVLPDLRAMLIAGEPLYYNDVAPWRETRAPQCAFFNLYGPSETTLAKFCYRVDQRPLSTDATLPVGDPIAGTRFIVVGESLAACAPNQAGEVLIRYKHASMGYYGLTREESGFIQNPFDGRDHVPVFRTGDIGFVRSDGKLVIVGRKDGLVKVRGNRVALFEVENIVRQHPSVRGAALKATTRDDGMTVLACYLETDGELEAIKQDLAPRIEQLSWPQYWVKVDQLPLTESGKIDRNRLPDPVPQSRPAEGSDADLALSKMMDIWAQVLHTETPVRPDDTFALLGGQSIEAVQVLLKVNAEFKRNVALDEFFQLHTPRALLAHVESLPEQDDSSPARINFALESKAAPDEALPLTGAQLRFWRWAGRYQTHQSQFQFTYTLHLEGVSWPDLVRAVDETIRDEVAFHLSFFSRGGEVYQKYSPKPPRLFVHDLRDAADGLARAQELFLASRFSPFAFDQETLVRAYLFRLSDDRAVFSIENQILASDGHTKTVFLQRIADRYNDQRTDESPFSFLDYAKWEQDNSVHWEEYAEFWKRVLEGVTPLRLPINPNPAPSLEHLSHSSRTVSHMLPPEAAGMIQRQAKTRNVSMASVLLAGLGRALSDYVPPGGSFLIISNSKRNVLGGEAIVGCFTDSLLFPVRRSSGTLAGDVEETYRLLLQCIDMAVPSFQHVSDRVLPAVDMCDPSGCPLIFAPQPKFINNFQLRNASVTRTGWDDNRWIWPVEVYPYIGDNYCDVVINYAPQLVSGEFISNLLERMVAGLYEFAGA